MVKLAAAGALSSQVLLQKMGQFQSVCFGIVQIFDQQIFERDPVVGRMSVISAGVHQIFHADGLCHFHDTAAGLVIGSMQ